jgi:hypothetical protein
MPDRGIGTMPRFISSRGAQHNLYARLVCPRMKFKSCNFALALKY